MNANLACENRDFLREVVMNVPTYIWLNTVTWQFSSVEQCDVRSERDTPYSTDIDVTTQILSEDSCFLIVFVIYHSQSTAKALKRYARIRRLLTSITTGYVP